MKPTDGVNLHTLEESSGEVLDLSGEEARALSRVGRKLASNEKWWSGNEESAVERTIIKCAADSRGWRVRVQDAVGAVSAAGAQVVVHPKIPLDHLLYLFERSGTVPRIDEQVVSLVSKESNFIEIVGQWFLHHLRQVLNRGLVKDYRLIEERLNSPKGRLMVSSTATSWYSGKFSFDCSYEEFDEDNSFNRVIFEAGRAIVSGRELFSNTTRKKARSLLFEFPPMKPFCWEDTNCTTDRRTLYYEEALTLARHILSSTGRELEHGSSASHSMLVKTPPLVEEGIRRILVQGLAPIHTVNKEKKRVSAQHTLNPDLVFNDGLVVGDVKYKLIGETWSRSDLNQLGTFAAGFRSPKGILIGFGKENHKLPKSIILGDHALTVVRWDASGELEPKAAALQLIAQVKEFLED